MVGVVVWITGVSGVGKTTLAVELKKKLLLKESSAIFLDGDELREILHTSRGDGDLYSREARLNFALQYSKICRLLALQGFNVVISTISLFNEIHTLNRKVLAKYFEVYLTAPKEILESRDPKGIYAEHSRGERRNVAGLDLQVDEPVNPDWKINCQDGASPSDLIEQLIKRVNEKYEDTL